MPTILFLNLFTESYFQILAKCKSVTVSCVFNLISYDGMGYVMWFRLCDLVMTSNFSWTVLMGKKDLSLHSHGYRYYQELITWTKLLRPSVQEFVLQLWERRLGICSHSSETNLGWKSWERGSSFLSGYSHKLFVACIRVVRWQESEPSGTSLFSSLKICYNQFHNSHAKSSQPLRALRHSITNVSASR